MNQHPSARSEVLVLGDGPYAEEEFRIRGLHLRKSTLAEFDLAPWRHARGVLLADTSDGFGLTSAYFRRHFHAASRAGLLTLIDVNAPGRAFAAERRDSEVKRYNFKSQDPELFRFVANGSAEVAQAFFAHHPGPEPGTPEILAFPELSDDDAEIIPLLRRAFWDCDRVIVERIHGGKTAKGTFRATATLHWMDEGPPQPMPFFVKIADREDAVLEDVNYSRWVDAFIPFYLRPSLCLKRSFRTYGLSVLIYNFVDAATPLRYALRSEQGAGALFSLFETTLRGLRAQTGTPEFGVLEPFIKDRVRSHEIRANFPDRLRIARRIRSSIRDPEALEKILVSIARRTPARAGIQHGDLHAGNVLIRGRDAIIIDFGSMGQAPLSLDAAFLEVSLAFGADDADAIIPFEEWRGLIDDAFLNGGVSNILRVGLDQRRLVWLRAALRELRHLVRCSGIPDMERTIVLCATMLRFARLDKTEGVNPNVAPVSEERRAYALVIADRLCESLENQHG